MEGLKLVNYNCRRMQMLKRKGEWVKKRCVDAHTFKKNNTYVHTPFKAYFLN